MSAKPRTPRQPPEVTWDVNAGIHLRLLKARIELRGTKLWKEFQGGERTFDAFSIHELAATTEEILAKHGVVYSFSVTRVDVGGPARLVEGDAIFIAAEREDDEVGREYRVHTVGEGIDDSDKGFGKAISYARKNGLIQGLNLAIGIDNEASTQKAAPKPNGAAPHPQPQPAPAYDPVSQDPPKFTFTFVGNQYELIPSQIIDSVQKFLKSRTAVDQVNRWLAENEANIAALWKFSDRQAFGVKKLADARIQELTEGPQ